MARPTMYDGPRQRPSAKPDHLPLPAGYRRVSLLSLDIELDLAAPFAVSSEGLRGTGEPVGRMGDGMHPGHDGGYALVSKWRPDSAINGRRNSAATRNRKRLDSPQS